MILGGPHPDIYFPWPTHSIDAPNPLIIPAIIIIIETADFITGVCGSIMGKSPHHTQKKKQKAPNCIAFIAPNVAIRGVDRKLQIPKDT